MLGSLKELILTPNYFCSRIIGLCAEPKYDTISLEDDIKRLLTGKPSDADGYIDRLYKEIATSTIHRETIKIVQFSDAHLDLSYKEGSNADCGVSYCCREDSDKQFSLSAKLGTITPAGKWGMKNYRCDPPQSTLESVLEEIKKQQPEYVFWTGDSTPHDDPYVSKDEITESLESITKIVRSYFPESESSFFFSLGNHDSFPNGQQDFEKTEPSKTVLDLLEYWVPEDQFDLFEKHNIYTNDIEEINARVISLNTQSCDFHNMYLWG